MKTYTQHKLTDPMLQRLSDLAASEGSVFPHPIDFDLIAGGFVTPVDEAGVVIHYASVVGISALAQARAEGW